MRGHPIGRAPDYTNAFLAMAYVWLMIALITAWAVWGFISALVLSSLAHAWLGYLLHKRRSAR